MAQKSASAVWLRKLWNMLPSKPPIGPPLPKKEVARLLKQVRGVLDRAITALERESKKTTKKAPARKRKPR